MYAFEVLQRLHKYNDANKLFEFLLYNQSLYLLSYRSKWFERVALNYESHLKNPIKLQFHFFGRRSNSSKILEKYALKTLQ